MQENLQLKYEVWLQKIGLVLYNFLFIISFNGNFITFNILPSSIFRSFYATFPLFKAVLPIVSWKHHHDFRLLCFHYFYHFTLETLELFGNKDSHEELGQVNRVLFKCENLWHYLWTLFALSSKFCRILFGNFCEDSKDGFLPPFLVFVSVFKMQGLPERG